MYQKGRTEEKLVIILTINNFGSTGCNLLHIKSRQTLCLPIPNLYGDIYCFDYLTTKKCHREEIVFQTQMSAQQRKKLLEI